MAQYDWFLDPYADDPGAYQDADGHTYTSCLHCGTKKLEWLTIVEDVYELGEAGTHCRHSLDCEPYARMLDISERVRLGNKLAHQVSWFLRNSEAVEYIDFFEEMAMTVDDWRGLGEAGKETSSESHGEERSHFLSRWNVDR